MQIGWEALNTALASFPILERIVRIFNIKPNTNLSLRHIVVKDFELIKGMLDGSFQGYFSQHYGMNILFRNNFVSNYLKSIHRKDFKLIDYQSWDETGISNIVNGTNQHYEVTIDIRELFDVCDQFDFKVTSQIVREIQEQNVNIEPNTFCKIVYHFDECGGSIIKSISFRRCWLVLLCIDNYSNHPVDVSGYSCSNFFPNLTFDYRNWDDTDGEISKVNLPGISLNPGESLVIPEFIILAPIDESNSEEYITTVSEHDYCSDYINQNNYKYDLLDSYGFNQTLSVLKPREDFNLIGPSCKIYSLYSNNDEIKVHKFNPHNILSFNGFLEVGSCPHLLGYTNGMMSYIGELLINGDETRSIEGFEFLIIAEVENETTFIDSLSFVSEFDKTLISCNEILRKGDFLLINNRSKSRFLEINGYYAPNKLGFIDNAIIADKSRILRQLNHVADQFIQSIDHGDLQMLRRKNFLNDFILCS